jgi:hypothetical protein
MFFIMSHGPQLAVKTSLFILGRGTGSGGVGEYRSRGAWERGREDASRLCI